MALIDCHDCGGKVSTKAVSCPHCGAPPITWIPCYECGEQVSDTEASCPHCGAPMADAEIKESPSAVPSPPSEHKSAAEHSDLAHHTGIKPPSEALGVGGAAARGEATNVDKVLCLLIPALWLVVRFVGGRTGAGPFALAGLAIGIFLLPLRGGC